MLRNDDIHDGSLGKPLRLAYRVALTLIALCTAMLLGVVIKDRFFGDDIWSKPSARRHISPAIRQAWPSTGVPV